MFCNQATSWVAKLNWWVLCFERDRLKLAIATAKLPGYASAKPYIPLPAKSAFLD